MLKAWRSRFFPAGNRRARRRLRRVSARLQRLEPRSLLSVAPTGVTIAPFEGSSFTGTVATFTATDDGPFTTSIDWGDGTTTDGSITSNGDTFSVTGTHTYTEDGTVPVSVAIRDEVDSTTTTAASTAQIGENVFALTAGAAVSTTEGVALSSVQLATFQDPNSSDVATDFTATVDWGDGQTTTGSVTGSGGNFTVTGDHTYADELSSNYQVTVTEADANHTIGPVSAAVDVAENDSGVLNPQTIAATEGATFSGAVASFTDNSTGQVASDFTATIDWGDGATTTGTVTGGSGNFTISGQHTYADEGTFTVLAAFSDDSPSTLTAIPITSAAVVSDADALTGVASVHATEGVPFNGAVATFTDTGYAENNPGDFAAEIDWGDGTTTSGSVTGSGGTFTVSGQHLYASDLSYPLSVTLTDDEPGTASATATGDADVADHDTLVPGAPLTLPATEGATFSGVLATFTDTTYPTNTPDDFLASIDWGDGTTTSGTVSGSPGSFTVSSRHVYAEEGTYTATVELDDDTPDTASADTTATINVADATLSGAAATVAATEGAAFSGVVATFTDADPNGATNDYRATIDWGDGNLPSPGSIVAASGAFQVTGSHAYAEDGKYTVTVNIADVDGGTSPPDGGLIAEGDGNVIRIPVDTVGRSTATVVDTATITEPSISVSPVAFVGQERSALVDIPVATFQHAGIDEPASGFAATIYWGDGTSSAGSIAQSGTTYTVLGSHIYLDEGTMPLLVHIADDTASATVVTSGRLFEELLPNGSVGTANERFIAEVFRDLLHRQVDQTALPYWSNLLDQGQSRLQVVQEIINTAMPGELGADLVQGMYEKYLGRDVDAAGMAFWMGILNFHETVEQTESNLVATQEFFLKAGGTNNGYITRLFELALGRAPDAMARASFDAALAGGMSREQVAELVFGSHEYHQKTVGGYFDSLIDANDRFINVTPYLDDLDFLDRPADAAGLAQFTAAMDEGLTDQQAWADFLSSDEFFAKTA